MEATKTESVSVPQDLSEILAQMPEMLGFEPGVSKRKMMGLLMVRGFEASVFAKREDERKLMYEALAKDPERDSAEDSYQQALASGRL